MHLRSVPTAILVALLPATLLAQGGRPITATSCSPDNGGITLTKGFCASVFADSLARPRHIVVAPNGDVFVGLAAGGVMALRDRNGDGIADERNRFAESNHATEVALFDGYLYTENGTDIVRYRLPNGSLMPSGPEEIVVKGLPPKGHSAKTFVIDKDGSLYVNVGSATNACQRDDRKLQSPGIDPCTELETRAGIWRFDARKLNQTQSQGEHFARGIRNAVSITINPHGDLYVMQHGRDQLGGAGANWPRLYNNEEGAELPAEEMFHVQRGDDFGWPYCYFDPEQQKKVLAPEYGGDGKQVGRCASKKGNVAYFPAHWAPNALLFYTGSLLPARYREGAFIAFHGSWNRAPLPQAGYKVVFQPMRNGRASGQYEIFADDFAPSLNDQGRGPRTGNRRPTGLAQGPDGALYITDDAGGRIWKVVPQK